MVMMVVMVAPEISVMVMVVSKLEVIFRSRLFVHRVQERRRIGNRFQQFGKRCLDTAEPSRQQQPEQVRLSELGDRRRG